MRKVYRVLCAVSVVMLALVLGSTSILAQLPAARAVLFYSPSCSHCHHVMTTVLPPLKEQYGDQLRIAEVDTTQPEGGALFEAAVDKFNPELVGVPLMVIGDHILVGSREIPEQLPGLIEDYLAQGGVGWPDLPNVEAVVADLGVDPALPGRPTLKETFTRDLAGNILAVVVLLLLATAAFLVSKPRPWQHDLAQRLMPWAFWAVLAVGLVAAVYLAYVETTQTEAVCGPIGDCNTVQQSEYALLFGILPMGVLGVLGYIAIGLSYAYATWGKGKWVDIAPAVTFLLAAFGLLFSTYLTFLEPFVIGATCAWCLTSALSMMALALLTADMGWARLKPKRRRYRRSKKRRRYKKRRR